MRPTIVWAAVLTSLSCGLGAGYMLGTYQTSTSSQLSASDDPPTRRRPSRATLEGPRARSSGEDRPSPYHGSRRSDDDDGRDRGAAEADGLEEDAQDPTSATLVLRDDETEAEAVARLQAEVNALRDERVELMGSPINAPTELAERFSGASMSAAVGAALVDESVDGGVEGTDCAEYPCIVFGRLEGDEEDMEEIERSAELSKYSDDVLTLLLWATTVDDELAPQAKMPETGLFALAFYSLDERKQRGEQLDRRIRARVMEYWNTDRPGLPENSSK